MKKVTIILCAFMFILTTGFICVATGGNEERRSSDPDLGFSCTEDLDRVDLERLESSQDLEFDSYWIDSWTADGEGFPWYTPERYTFNRGDIVECCVYHNQTYNSYDWKRWDRFWITTGPCAGAVYTYNAFFGFMPAGLHITGIPYDSMMIPPICLPCEIEWASMCVDSLGKFYTGLRGFEVNP